MDGESGSSVQWQAPETAVRVASNLLVFGGALSLGVAFTPTDAPGLEDWEPFWLGVFASGAIAVGLLLRLFPAQVWRGRNILMAMATIYIGVGQVLTAGVSSFGPVLILWPVLWSFAFLSRKVAWLQAGLAMGVVSAIFIFQEGWDPPFPYIFFLGGTILVTSWTVAYLVQQVETYAGRERTGVNVWPS